MSVKVMSLVWGWALPATEKLVALKLADCADDRGYNAWPAVATIATDCGLTRRGTQKVLERLVARGCIEVQAGHTNRKSTTYRVRLHAKVGGEPGSPLEVNDVRPSEVNDIPAEANHVPVGGEPRSPLEVNDVRPIRPTTVRDPSCTPRARDGRRPHPLDETPVLLPRVVELFAELAAGYPNKARRNRAEREWQALNPSVEQAEFIVAHVRMRVRAGWVRDAGGPRWIPQLWRFLEERGWTEGAANAGGAAAAPVSAAAEGMLTMRTCPGGCGRTLEGRIVNSVAVFDRCPACAPAGDDSNGRAEELRP